ncbi:hypothetical protein BKA93DRAFT_797489 [Sparassis latifolia]
MWGRIKPEVPASFTSSDPDVVLGNPQSSLPRHPRVVLCTARPLFFGSQIRPRVDLSFYFPQTTYIRAMSRVVLHTTPFVLLGLRFLDPDYGSQIHFLFRAHAGAEDPCARVVNGEARTCCERCRRRGRGFVRLFERILSPLPRLALPSVLV